MSTDRWIAMTSLPPEDQPDVVSIGPVGPIPIIDDDDPRFAEERAAWSSATAKAQALHSADELVSGLHDPDWRVRHESIDRLVARWPDDPRTLPTLLELAEHDPVWQVRSAATMPLTRFDPERVVPVARGVMEDSVAEVRWAANFVLFQFGLADSPDINE
jgi:HEAT repeat protein